MMSNFNDKPWSWGRPMSINGRISTDMVTINAFRQIKEQLVGMYLISKLFIALKNKTDIFPK